MFYFIITFIVFFLHVSQIFGETLYDVNRKNDVFNIYDQTSNLELAYQNVKMPNNFSDMGLIHVSYLLDLNRFISVGPSLIGSFYGGNKAGFTAFGIKSNLNIFLYNNFYFFVNFFFGGGGTTELSQNGMLVNTALGLNYKFKNDIRIGVAYSALNLPKGIIHSQQVLFNIYFPLYFQYAQYSLSSYQIEQNRVNFINSIKNNHDNYLGLIGAAYFPTNTSISNNNRYIGYLQNIGLSAGHYFNKDYFSFVQIETIIFSSANSSTKGYTQFLGGLASNFMLRKNLYIIPQLGIGFGGGGEIMTAGGLLISPKISLSTSLNKVVYINFGLSYIVAPYGDFRALSFNTELKYFFNGLSGFDKENYFSKDNDIFFSGWRWVSGNQSYVSPNYDNSKYNGSVNMISGQLDFFLNSSIYLLGQTNFSYWGDAGSYAEGFLGVGTQVSTKNRHKRYFIPFIEFLSGAGGSGNIEDGVLIKTITGVIIPISTSWSIKINVGKVFNLSKAKKITTLGLGVNYIFSTPRFMH